LSRHDLLLFDDDARDIALVSASDRPELDALRSCERIDEPEAGVVAREPCSGPVPRPTIDLKLRADD